MNISDRMHNILGILSKSFLWERFIGLLQRMTDTGDKSYAELEDIKVLLEKIVEQNEQQLKAERTRRWKE